MPVDQNLYTLLSSGFPADDAAIAIEPVAGSSVTYAQLQRTVSRYANAFKTLGVIPGDRITVQVEKSLANVYVYLAALKCGAVFNPLNTAYTVAELDYFVSDAKPAVVVCDPANAGAVSKSARSHGVAHVMTLASDGGSLADLANAQSAELETVPRQADHLASLVYTSGTTGRSKGAMLTHGNLGSNARTLHRLWGFEPDDVLIHALPVFHVHGLYVALNTSFLNGSRILWLPKFDARSVVALLPRASVLMGVPTFYTRLLAEPDLDADLCRSMRLFISGSAPLLADTHKAFQQRTGHRILERYGMTEAGMITSNPYEGERVAGTVGFALPDVEVRVVDTDGRTLPAGETGILEIRGPNVFAGYWDMPEKTAEEFREDGFFITGDMAVLDRDGRVSIVGRGKDLIISGGLNVYPKEIETEIDGLEGIAESAVVGVPHADFGEAVIAVVVCGAGPDLPNEHDVIDRLGNRLARFKVPKRVFFVDELPRNTMGKVQKAELRSRFERTFNTQG